MSARPAMRLWVVRRDGWMRRQEFAFPLDRYLQIRDPLPYVSTIAKIDSEAEPEPVVAVTRCFALREVKNIDCVPWGDSCFYQEV